MPARSGWSVNIFRAAVGNAARFGAFVLPSPTKHLKESKHVACGVAGSGRLAKLAPWHVLLARHTMHQTTTRVQRAVET